METSTFPETAAEALAFLYVKSQDLSDKTPAEISDMYDSAFDRIRDYRNSGRPKQRVRY